MGAVLFCFLPAFLLTYLLYCDRISDKIAEYSKQLTETIIQSSYRYIRQQNP